MISFIYLFVYNFFFQASRLMDEEERQDTQLRERFKQKWTPKPSADLTAQLREEAAKYRGILENAVRADGIVREKYNSHRRAMDVLCKGEVWSLINAVLTSFVEKKTKIYILIIV